MKTNRDQFIDWLKEIGASNIVDQGEDESISFEHNGKKIQLYGIWFNDRTAGLGIDFNGYQ